MLQKLYVKNVALISEAEIEPDRGLNVLSGETGSGKSVILESINFVLGSKADKTMIRYGEHEATVRAEFSVKEDSEAVKKLEEYDIESDGTIVISRKFNADGKGAIKVNGCSVTLSMLKSITQHLVDVHGQSEHFFLLEEQNQIKVLDLFLGESANEIKKRLAEDLEKRRELSKKIAELGGDTAERERKLDMLDYRIKEIGGANLREGEYDELAAKQNIIANTEKIMSSIAAVRSLFTDDGGCVDLISSAEHYINGISGYSEEYSQIGARLEGLMAEASDIADNLGDLADNLGFDEREAQEISERIDLIKGLKRKYGATESEILKFLEDAQAEYDLLSDSAANVEKYNAKIAEINGKIYENCVKLTGLRKSAAEKFCNAVIGELKTLNISNAQFSVTFNDYGKGDINSFTANGADNICFLFSANKGEPLKPLSKVISGGEMSRFMLAVKTQIKSINGISTYIFDEIDAGISGFTANTVARKFLSKAKNTQILAVSHLPQVCAASDAQFLIYKEVVGDKTLTRVKKLDEDSKIKEIVRLSGGVDSPAARQHALELVNQFK